MHVELLGLQVDRLLRVTDEFVRHRAAGVKWASYPLWMGGQPPEHLPAATVVQALATSYRRAAEDPTRGEH